MGRGSTVGDIVREVYRFLNEGAEPDYKVISPVNAGEEVLAKDFFYGFGSKQRPEFLVKPERLPFDINVKAVLTNRGRVRLETERVNFNELSEKLEEQGSSAEIQGKSILYRGKPVIQTRTQNISRYPKVNLRTVSTLLPKYGTPELGLACRVIDTLDNYSCYDPRSEAAEEVQSMASGGTADPRLEIKLQQQMLQLMEQTQLPKLAMKMTMNQVMLAKLIRTNRVLRMSGAELDEHVQNELEANPALS